MSFIARQTVQKPNRPSPPAFAKIEQRAVFVKNYTVDHLGASSRSAAFAYADDDASSLELQRKAYVQ
jgi:hypothetical protein